TDEAVDGPPTARMLPAISGQDGVFGLAWKSCRHEVGGQGGVLQSSRPIRDLSHALTLERHDRRLDAAIADLQDARRWRRVAPDVARHLKPRPLEPAWILPQPRRGGCRCPLVHSTGVEHEHAAGGVDQSAMRVAEHDDVRGGVLAPKHVREPPMWMEVAERDSPEKRLGLLEPPAAIAVHGHDALALDHLLAHTGARPV